MDGWMDGWMGETHRSRQIPQHGRLFRQIFPQVSTLGNAPVDILNKCDIARGGRSEGEIGD